MKESAGSGVQTVPLLEVIDLQEAVRLLISAVPCRNVVQSPGRRRTSQYWHYNATEKEGGDTLITYGRGRLKLMGI